MGEFDELGLKGAGVEPVRIPEVDLLAENYIKERDKRLALTPKEVAAKIKLIDALHGYADQIGKQKDGSLVYRYGEMVITLTPGKEKLKVEDLEKVEE
jgi:hypothetical protein